MMKWWVIWWRDGTAEARQGDNNGPFFNAGGFDRSSGKQLVETSGPFVHREAAEFDASFATSMKHSYSWEPGMVLPRIPCRQSFNNE